VGDIAHAAVTRSPPISLDTTVPVTGCFAYAVGVWIRPSFKVTIFCRRAGKPNVTIRTLFESLFHTAMKKLRICEIRVWHFVSREWLLNDEQIQNPSAQS
jgi:hypothetical protein